MVCVCERKFTTVTRVVHEVPLDQPSLKTQKDPENPENPENEELSLKFSRDTVMVVLFFGKYESTDTGAFRIDKNFKKKLKKRITCCS